MGNLKRHVFHPIQFRASVVDRVTTVKHETPVQIAWRSHALCAGCVRQLQPASSRGDANRIDSIAGV